MPEYRNIKSRASQDTTTDVTVFNSFIINRWFYVWIHWVSQIIWGKNQKYENPPILILERNTSKGAMYKNVYILIFKTPFIILSIQIWHGRLFLAEDKYRIVFITVGYFVAVWVALSYTLQKYRQKTNVMCFPPWCVCLDRNCFCTEL